MDGSDDDPRRGKGVKDMHSKIISGRGSRDGRASASDVVRAGPVRVDQAQQNQKLTGLRFGSGSLRTACPLHATCHRRSASGDRPVFLTTIRKIYVDRASVDSDRDSTLAS